MPNDDLLEEDLTAASFLLVAGAAIGFAMAAILALFGWLIAMAVANG